MDDNGQRENGTQARPLQIASRSGISQFSRHNGSKEKMSSALLQWIIPPHLMKDHHALTMKLMNILAERDAAIQERNIAISEKKAAFAERDVAIMQRDQAITERNNALMERENALSALEYRDNSHVNGGNVSTCPPGCGIPRGTKHIHHPQQVHHSSNMNGAHYNSRDMHIADAFPISVATMETEKPRRAKPMKEAKALPLKKSSRSLKKRKNENEDMSKRVTVAKLNDWKNGQCLNDIDEDLNKQLPVSKPDWKNQNLVLNQVTFDESSMPPPGCSCTGRLMSKRRTWVSLFVSI